MLECGCVVICRVVPLLLTNPLLLLIKTRRDTPCGLPGSVHHVPLFPPRAPFSEAGTPFDVEVGPIRNQSEARAKANRYIKANPQHEWTGHWRTTQPGKMSVIQVR